MRNIHEINNALKELASDLDAHNSLHMKQSNTTTWARARIKDLLYRLPNSSPQWLITELEEIKNGMMLVANATSKIKQPKQEQPE